VKEAEAKGFRRGVPAVVRLAGCRGNAGNLESWRDVDPLRAQAWLLLQARVLEQEGAEMANVALIVMEPGSGWPGKTGASDHVVVAGDTPELLRRAASRLVALHQEGHRVRVAVLACNDATDPEAVERRAALAHQLLGAVACTRFGRLVLTSGDRVCTEVRRDLLSLAGALSCRLEGTLVTVSIRFGAPCDPQERMSCSARRERATRTPSNRQPVRPHAPGERTLAAEMS
jgi:hypothetical protein